MRRGSAAISILLLVLVIVPSLPASARSSSRGSSDNVTVVRRYSYKGGNEIDALGRFLYASRWGDRRGGVHILDVSGKSPRRVGFAPCPGFDNDVAVVRPGIIAVSSHGSQCGRLIGKAGIQLIDVSDPKRPRHLDGIAISGGVHTITVYPGKDLIYASPGFFGTGDSGIENIIDVSDPRNIKIAATFESTVSGCHDIGFHMTRERKLAFCPGEGGTQVWDVSDPLGPEAIGNIVLPFLQLPHTAAVTPDGRYVAISAEDYAAHLCTPRDPTGALWIYDISDPRMPILAGYYKVPRSHLPVGTLPFIHSCTAHNFNFVPGTRILVSAWYGGGTSLVDLSEPALPREIAYYHPDDANALSAFWYRGLVYVNDMNRGLDVLRIEGV